MLALSNKEGIVESSLPGLADIARVSFEECQQALATLMAVDKWSRSKESEGRRIEEVEGGWKILNHSKYRAKMSLEERRSYLAEKQREYRERIRAIDRGKMLAQVVKEKVEAEQFHEKHDE